jgi:hypothetical protein
LNIYFFTWCQLVVSLVSSLGIAVILDIGEIVGLATPPNTMACRFKKRADCLSPSDKYYIQWHALAFLVLA